MLLTDFNYHLPAELIASYPLPIRHESRLLCLNKKNNTIAHKQFLDFISLLTPKDLLICNNTKVIPARLLGNKETGGCVEMLVERILNQHHILAKIRASKAPKMQSRLFFTEKICFIVKRKIEDLYELQCEDSRPILEIIENIGQIPLPHYLHRDPEESDKERYQTIYAKHDGSVAAPTAGLHFDEPVFEKLTEKNIAIEYLTLHVGAGTFVPVRINDITQHRMHSEYMIVPAEVCEKIKKTKTAGGRVIAVGTTTARALETASLSGNIQPFSGETNIFIYPGFQFQCIDGLITNFHLPGSTLLMLVAAFGGYENVMSAYRIAVAERYRFFSYGDAMIMI